MIPSPQQQAIFSWFESGADNLVVRARAGTGKTTTLVHGVDRAPERQILLAAFNRRIADELVERVRSPRVDVKTLHGVGFRFVNQQWKGVRLDKKGERARRHAQFVCGDQSPDDMLDLVCKLSSLTKGVDPFTRDPSRVADLAIQFNLVPDDLEDAEEMGWSIDRIAASALRVMELALERDGEIDFDDMIFVPLRLGWVKGWWDLVCIDEAQDMNTAQLELALRSCRKGGRICVIGDDRQAIYGFRGADSGSLDRLKGSLRARELGLTITRRCPKSVVALAVELVPDFQAAPEAPDGAVRVIAEDVMLTGARPGDFVLSRTNAPLARICLALLRSGIRARIEGRDIAKHLIGLVRRLSARDVETFIEKLAAWEKRETARAMADGRTERAEHVADMAETLRELTDGVATLPEFIARIDELFSDRDGAPRVVCSTVHKAKGLEAERVFVLRPTLRPWKGAEESNIAYVAYTRSKAELFLVGEFPKEEERR